MAFVPDVAKNHNSQQGLRWIQLRDSTGQPCTGALLVDIKLLDLEKSLVAERHDENAATVKCLPPESQMLRCISWRPWFMITAVEVPSRAQKFGSISAYMR